MNWDEANERAEVEVPSTELASGVHLPGGAPALVVTDRWDLTMLDMPITGAHIFVKPISRADAMDLANRFQAPMVSANERGMAMLEQELGMPGQQRARLTPATRVLVCEFVNWRDKRWFLIEYKRDG